MRLAILVTLLACTSDLPSQTQINAPTRDAQALQIAGLVMAASGLSTFAPLTDLIETGTIAYNWANKNVEGPVKITEIGTSDIQLSASLSVGNHRWFASDGRGKTQRIDGDIQAIPYHCGISQVALTLPILRLAQAVNNPDYELKYLGTTPDDKDGTDYRISMKDMAGRNAAEQATSALDSAEFVVDSKSYLVVQLKDAARSETNMFNSVPRTLTFSDYRSQNGIELPFSIEENVNNAHTWTLHLDGAQLNTGVDRASIGF